MSLPDTFCPVLTNKKNSHSRANLLAFIHTPCYLHTTDHYMFKDSECLLGLAPTNKALSVTLPDGTCGTCVTSSHTAFLDLPCLPLDACRVDVFHGFIGSLLFTDVLYDTELFDIYTSSYAHFFDSSGVVGVKSLTF